MADKQRSTRPKARADQVDNLCGAFVSWWDGEYEGTCELPEGHQGPHYDGISCFDNEGDEVELKSRPIPPVVASVGYYKSGQLYQVQNVVLNSGNNHIVSLQPEMGVEIRVEVQMAHPSSNSDEMEVGGKQVDTLVEKVVVAELQRLRQLYDKYENNQTKDFEGNAIATWSGYKWFRNPISDRIEEITGVRSDPEVNQWLDDNATLSNLEGR